MSRTVTIALPTLNEERYVGDCLDSLVDATEAAQDAYDYEFEVLVLDSHSEDDTREIAEDHPIVDEVHLVGDGILHARHAGYELADGEIVVSVDADSEYVEEYLRELLAPFERDDEDVALTYGPVYGEKRLHADAWLRLALQYGLPLVGREWVSGSNRAVRRNAYFDAGGFELQKDGRSLFEVMFEEQMLFPRRVAAHGAVEFVDEARSRQSARTLEQLFLLDRKQGGASWDCIGHYDRFKKLVRR